MATLASIDLLRSVPIFAGLADRHLEAIGGRCRLTSIPAGTAMLVAGVPSDALHMLLSGQARVVDDRGTGVGSEIGVLGKGAHVGESTLDGTPSPFSVVTLVDTEILSLSREDLEQLKAAWPDIDAALRDYIDRRHDASADGPARRIAPDAGAPPVSVPRALPADEPNRPAFDDGDRIQWRRRPYAAARLTSRRRTALRAARAIDAGPCCLAAICRRYGKRVALNRVRELANAARTGATLRGLQRAAEALGYETVATTASAGQLSANVLPAIVGLTHRRWAVVDDVGAAVVRIADPVSGGRRTLSRAEFLAVWTGETLFLRPTDAFADVEHDRPALARFWPYLRPLKPFVAELLIASLLIQIVSLALPSFARFVIDDMIARRDERWLWPSLEGIAALLCVYLAVSFARRHLLQFISRQLDAQVVSDFYAHLLRLPVRFFESRAVGDVVNRFEETDKITQFLTGAGVGFFIDIATAVLYVALMAHYHLRLTALALVFVTLEILQLSYVTPKLGRGFRELFQEGLDSEGLLVESLSGLRTIKLLAIEHYTRWHLEGRLVRQLNTSFRTLTYGTAASVASQFLSSLSVIAVLFYGALLVLRQELTVGQLVAFGILTRGLTMPFATLASAWDRLQDTLNSVDQLNDIIETPPESPDAPTDDRVELHHLQGHVRFDAVSFRYEEDGAEILQRVSFECHPGEHVAVVGRSGSGKSTLVKLLLGFYRATDGRVTVDGFNVNDVWLPSLRRQIGVVLQDAYLFRGAIRANITQGAPSVPFRDVVTATRLVNAHGFIGKLAGGYETVLDDNGANLSGGQRQQVAIARALVQRRPMLILDEATSNLDNESERYLHGNLDAEFRDSTIITITQRLQAIRNADLIVVMDRGAAVEQGDHAHLMARQGLYYQLYMEQNP
jgi:ATP-binding cassette subfamily B protein